MEHGKYQHFFRKLHSLAGIIPVGVFMTVHLLVNYSAVWGIDSYNKAAGFMVNLPFKYFLELFVIFLPLLFHGIYGVVIAFQAKQNVGQYHYARNWKFFFQRITGLIAFVFLIWHVWETKVQVEFNGVEANYNLMAGIVDNGWMLTLYIIGILSCIYHFINGFWTFLITWGITASTKSQKITEYIAIVLFFGLAFVGIRAILAFA
ncbi:succinate dehydrogenase cytochrome b558 subunit [Neobacillus sp. OS1-32]|jgi:succinate dehydrogenase / fumarate reductase cytochrome b subunit|uniref:Succinate dehydrogenase cytochrome b558 subunit n=1 Tax=Neobacillus paridis TaxID=2803862 RepID=A0ABS1TLZ8_9BACI|nr:MULTISPECIES: succinate dehydrogenase cytochrome b558 subunit [Neobacillus]MBL4950925.1 succinate dehydrogenase cytochrome b558 subunit [Neobacillus paridis]WML29989.1 succinate dehydrogenase cytochrome b558 subunit [Neobacillus sp. OS1-32]